jgi:hypothetical protein
LSGSGSNSRADEAAPAGRTRKTRIGRVMFERLLADVFESKVEFTRRILANACRDADPAGLGQRFEPCRDIDAVAKDVAVLDEDVALMDADAELDAALVAGDLRVDQLAAQRLEPTKRFFLVGPDQPRVAGDIGGQDRRQPAFDPLSPGFMAQMLSRFSRLP